MSETLEVLWYLFVTHLAALLGPSQVNASVWRCAGPRQSQHTLCVAAQVCYKVSLSLSLTVSLELELELEFYLLDRQLHHIGEIIRKYEIILSGDSHKGTKWPLT